MKLDAQIKALQRGDMSGFDAIYAATQKAVYFMAFSVLRDKTKAEDAMQTAYVRVLQCAEQYRGGSISAWVVKIARNVALNMLKTDAHAVSMDVEENLNLFGSDEQDDYGLTIELARRILETDEFQILMMITAQGYKRREVSEIMDLPIGTVTWKYRQALGKLKTELEIAPHDSGRKRK